MVHYSVLLSVAVAVVISQFQETTANKTVPCTKTSCEKNKVCDLSLGKCVDNPCNLVDCGPHEDCNLQYVQCFAAPCPPLAVCIARPQPQLQGEPCGWTSCRPPQVCDASVGACVDPCRYHRCPAGQQCYVQTVQCVRAPCPPIAQCRRRPGCGPGTCPEGEVCEDGQCVADSRCALVLCQANTYCYKGICFKNVPCQDTQCSGDPYTSPQKCYVGSEPCDKPPCPSKLLCRPDKCAVVRCASNTTCVDGACVPKDACL